METFKNTIWILLFVVCFEGALGVSVDKDLTLSDEQKRILETFKANVSPKLKQDYQRKDLYLLQWLRAQNFDLKRAEEMLVQDQIWRQKNNMDAILQEDWSEFEKEYPYCLGGQDKEGRPILIFYLTKWDVRKAVLSGQKDKLVRYLDSTYEQAASKVRDLQDNGKTVTQFVVLLNLENFSLAKQGCLSCLPVYSAITRNQDNHYPGAVHKITTINTPKTFEIIFNIVSSVASPEMTNLIHMYNTNKEIWGPKLFEDISPDQLPVSFGGTKKYGH